MTKKTFELVAEIISQFPDFEPELKEQKKELAIKTALKFIKENPRFDEKRFLEACKVE